ncbi:MAG: hypothetical protein ACK5LV_04690 [Lachnospirales bacterium]
MTVAYIEIDKKDGSVKTMSFSTDGQDGHYYPATFGDTVVIDGDIQNRELIEVYLDDNVRGKTQEEISNIPDMHGEVDTYTGATVTPNNAVRMLEGLFDYHNRRYGQN